MSLMSRRARRLPRQQNVLRVRELYVETSSAVEASPPVIVLSYIVADGSRFQMLLPRHEMSHFLHDALRDNNPTITPCRRHTISSSLCLPAGRSHTHNIYRTLVSTKVERAGSRKVWLTEKHSFSVTCLLPGEFRRHTLFLPSFLSKSTFPGTISHARIIVLMKNS